MAQTNIAYGSDQAIILQSAGLFAANMQRLTTLNRLAGPMPKDAQAQAMMRFQTKNNYPIVRVRDLQKMAGDSVNFNLINPTGGEPIMGSNYAEGQGQALSFDQDSLKINQSRYPISGGDTMSQQRTVHELRGLARANAYNYMRRLSDQRILVHMAGSRGFAIGGEWVVPLAAGANFASIMINTVKAPTNNRHFISTGSGIESVAASGNEITIQNTDVANLDMIDMVRTWLDGVDFPPPPVVFDGDKMAHDSPIRVLLVSSEQYNSIIKSTTGNTSYRALQAQAMARAQMAKNNPLFMGESLLWNGILVVKMPKPIRFYAGNAINWCASATSATETTTDLVPSAFSTTHAVDRALLLGGQALCEAFGNYMRMKTGKKMDGPYFWSEKLLDHDDKLEVLVGMIDGMSKVRFSIDMGEQVEPTDYGVVAIDTAVRLAAT
jgi:N4-gp56 family major capsid protein